MANEEPAQRVHIVDFHMPFASMVSFMVKWVIATIPAIVILVFLLYVLFGLLSVMFGTINPFFPALT